MINKAIWTKTERGYTAKLKHVGTDGTKELLISKTIYNKWIVYGIGDSGVKWSVKDFKTLKFAMEKCEICFKLIGAIE